MGLWQAYAPAAVLPCATFRPPLVVVGVTHPQTCLVLHGRLRALRRAGFRVVLVASPGSLLEETARAEGVEALGVPIRRASAPVADLIALFRLCRVLWRLRPDMTEFSTPKAGLLGNLAAFLCRVPKRVYILRGLRLETAQGLQRHVLRWAEWVSAACSHVVVCNSESLRAIARQERIAPARKLRVLGHGSSHGVDVERFTPGPDVMRGDLGIPADAPVIGFVGRLTRDKGVPELMDAFDLLLQQCPQAYLLLVGWFDASEDAISAELRQRIAGHERVVHTGFVADAAPYYRAMDLMALPTWREGLPNAVLEAAASGVPVITTLATGARDAVIPEVTGLLVPAGYPEAIAEAALKLIADPVRRAKTGRAARAWIMERFVERQVVERTVALYRELVRAGSADKGRVPITDAAAAAR